MTASPGATAGDVDVAIVGGGFAGTMVAVQLARQGFGPLRIAIFDQTGAFGMGAAYAASSDHALLNVRAKAMGAFPDAEGDFVRWLTARGYAADDPLLGERFLPRKLYGAYLRDLLEQSCGSDVRIARRHERVTDIAPVSGGYMVGVAAGSWLRARSVVLALGNLPARRVEDQASARPGDAPVVDAWTLLGRNDPIASTARVLIVGTGLTALDVLLTLDAHGHRGRIVMLSRHGRFPLAHQPSDRAPIDAPSILSGTPIDVLRTVRRLAHDSQRRGLAWQQLIDAIRPQVPRIWQNWTRTEQQQFLRHLAPLWNVHRHRAPQSTLDVRDRLLQSDRLLIATGQVRTIERSDGVQLVHYAERHSGRERTIETDLVVDCTGPQRDFRRSKEPLIEALFERGLAMTDPLGMGFAATPDGRLVNAAAMPLFALGAPLHGMLYETTAVREVRRQAASVAGGVLAALRRSDGAVAAARSLRA